jgi:hypothetical protein
MPGLFEANHVTTEKRSETSQKPQMRRLTLDLDADLFKRIRTECFKKDISMASEIRRVLNDYYSPAEGRN